MRNDQFSVLCSLYMKEQPEYLEQCLESIAWQSIKANEVVVVHDGPLTKELHSVLNQWRDKLPLKEVILPENVGLGKALNKGLASCTYELVIRADTDDVNHRNRFEKQINHMRLHPDVAVCSSHIYEFEIDYNSPLRIKRVPTQNRVLSYSLKRNPINHMSAIFRKSAIDSVGGYQDLMYMEDYYLWLRLLAKDHKIDNIDDTLVSARIGNGMLERRRGATYIKSELFLLKKIYNLNLSKSPMPIFYYAIRITSRLVPKILFKKIYSFIRNN